MNSPEYQEVLDAALTLIHSRQHVSPKRLGDPGPDREQVENILTAAGAAPDHGQITPWRLVIVPPERRQLLAEAFAEALVERDFEATEEQKQDAREKARRGPFLFSSCFRSVSCPTVTTRPRPYAENDVPQPQLDLALGLTKVKPPVSPSVT